jgi:hypothetical protein
MPSLLYIGNLPRSDTDVGALTKIFPTAIRIQIFNQPNGDSRGCAHAEFIDKQEANRVLGVMRGRVYKIEGKELMIKLASKMAFP